MTYVLTYNANAAERNGTGHPFEIWPIKPGFLFPRPGDVFSSPHETCSKDLVVVDVFEGESDIGRLMLHITTSDTVYPPYSGFQKRVLESFINIAGWHLIKMHRRDATR